MEAEITPPCSYLSHIEPDYYLYSALFPCRITVTWIHLSRIKICDVYVVNFKQTEQWMDNGNNGALPGVCALVVEILSFNDWSALTPSTGGLFDDTLESPTHQIQFVWRFINKNFPPCICFILNAHSPTTLLEALGWNKQLLLFKIKSLLVFTISHIQT